MSSIVIAIPSRARPVNVPIVQKILPSATWFVSEEEEESYRNHGARFTVAHPTGVSGMGKKRQWILDYLGDQDVFMIDDDVKYVWCNVGRLGRRVEDPEAILQIIENTRLCATDAGTSFFGFAQSWDVRKYTPNEPFTLSGWVGSAVGFIGRNPRYDQGLSLRNDVAYSLRVLLEKRIIWRDNRFSFVCERFKNTGGLATIRSSEKDTREVRKLTEEWGQNISFTPGKEKLHVQVSVPRRQNIHHV